MLVPMRKPIDSAREVAGATTDAFRKTAGLFTSALRGIGRGVFYPVTSARRHSAPAPGTAPGIEHYLKDTHSDIPVRITLVTYGEGSLATRHFDSAEAALEAADAAAGEVRWLNLDGLNAAAVDRVCRHYGVHTLAAEDVLNTFQRPKLEFFADHLQATVRQIQVTGDKLKNEQITFFLFRDTLISFQEETGDVFDPVRRRLETPASRFRTHRADYLFYALLDSIVDHLFPLLEGYGTALEELEEMISTRPSPECQRRLFSMKRDLSLQRRTLWPLREVVDQLYRDDSGRIGDNLKPFFRDVQDHAVQIIDLLEVYRDTASGLGDLYQTTVGNRMNEIMKVLTIMASFFIPITFLAGVYGMNFEHIPELAWPYAYPVFWCVCLGITLFLAIHFRRKGWIGRR